jgi:hypothetical protein
MPSVHPRFDWPNIRDTVIDCASFYVDDNGQNLQMALTYWPFSKSDGSPDFRYNPQSETFLVADFLDEAETIMRRGHFREWQRPSGETLERLQKIQNLASLSPTMTAPHCKIKEGGCYWTGWQYAPLYWSHQWGAVSSALASLRRLEAATR